jgi:hypothetical protein
VTAAARFDGLGVRNVGLALPSESNGRAAGESAAGQTATFRTVIAPRWPASGKVCGGETGDLFVLLRE